MLDNLKGNLKKRAGVDGAYYEGGYSGAKEGFEVFFANSFRRIVS